MCVASIILSCLCAICFLCGLHNLLKYHSQIRESKPQLCFYLTSLLCIACCCALLWVDEYYDQYLQPFSFGQQSCYFWCLLLNYELLRHRL
jgi:hypothetical protein